jgi:hypothetical protein
MVYREFKNKHHGQKVIISGCGVSASDLKNPEDYFTIGVNDIGRIYQPNYLVVLNDKQSFKPGRWEWIENSKSPFVFTHIKTLGVPDEKRVVLQLGRYGGCDLEKESVDYTSNSTYVACIIAAYMGFTKIGIIGMDFTPDHFFAETGEHSLARKVNVISQEYSALRTAFLRRGIEFVNLSQVSRITSIPKQKIEEF